MRLHSVIGLCMIFGAVAYAGDGTRICEPCDTVDSALPCEDQYQTVNGTTVGASNGDYAYVFCGLPGGHYRFSFCEGGGFANWDTALSVQPFGCGEYLVCNDDYCGLQSQLDFDPPYYYDFVLVVDGYGSASGPYTLAYRGPSCPISPSDESSWGSIKALFK